MPVSAPTKPKGFVEPKAPRPAVLPAPLVPPPTPPPPSMQPPQPIEIPMRTVQAVPIAPIAMPVSPTSKTPEPPGERLVRLHDYQPDRGGSFGLIKGLSVCLRLVQSAGIAYLAYTVKRPTLPGKSPTVVTGGAGGTTTESAAATVAGMPITLRNAARETRRSGSSRRVSTATLLDRRSRAQDAAPGHRRVSASGRERPTRGSRSSLTTTACRCPANRSFSTARSNGSARTSATRSSSPTRSRRRRSSARTSTHFHSRDGRRSSGRGNASSSRSRGRSYWILIAGTDSDIEGRIKQKLEEQMAISVDRRGWHEQPAEMDTLVAAKDAFALKAPLGVWQKYDAEPEDEAGVLFLASKAADGDPKKSANMLAVRLARSVDPKDAFEAGRKFFTARAKASAAEYAVALVDEREPGKAVDLGGVPGTMVELRLLRAGETVRYWLLGTFTSGDATYALQLRVRPWDRRANWKSRLRGCGRRQSRAVSPTRPARGQSPRDASRHVRRSKMRDVSGGNCPRWRVGLTISVRPHTRWPLLVLDVAGLLTLKRLSLLGHLAGQRLAPEDVVAEADDREQEQDERHEAQPQEHHAQDAADRDGPAHEQRQQARTRRLRHRLDHERPPSKSVVSS